MTIVEKIIASIQSAVSTDSGDPLPVYYHDDATLNLLTSEMDFPCALVMLLTQGQAVQEAGMVKERVTAAVFFVEPSEFDMDAVDNEAIIDRCKGRAFQWLLTLSADEYFSLTALNRTTRVYDRYDDIVTGFGVSVDLTELEGICV